MIRSIFRIIITEVINQEIKNLREEIREYREYRNHPNNIRTYEEDITRCYNYILRYRNEILLLQEEFLRNG